MQRERRFSSPPATKFALPKVSPLFVPRTRLTARLKNSLSRKLTIISSPAGFGKTSLVADWLKDRPEDFIWIQMHDDDNDPVRFFSSLIAGLRFVHQGFGATILDAMHSIGSPPVEDIVNLIVHELEAVSRETILVFDDLHIIQRRDIYRILERLLQLLPLQIHLFFISRKDPPLSISKLRVDRQLNELRAPDLSFTPAETRDLLIDKMRIPLSDNSIETLFTVTEGWIAGLQMAVLSIRKRDNADDFIAGLNGTARDIFDYLDEEVLSRQPANVRQFLMETSILGSFNASLCEALTGQKNAADMIRKFEAANLFIFPLDDYRQWYRYHGFFADGLRQRLTASFGDSRIAELHALASRWYYENGDPTAAIRHALAADDFETAADIIEPMAETIVRLREARMLQKWFDAMPEKVILSRPVLLLYKALLLIDDSSFKQLSQYLDRINSLSSDAEEAGRLMVEPVYQGRILSLRALLAGLRFDFGEARQLAETSLELMEGQTCAFKMLSLVITGGIAYIDGKPDEARRIFLLLKRLLREMDSLTLEYCALGVLYCLEIPLGNLRLIEAMVDETMAEHDKKSELGEHDPAYGLLLILKSIIFYERYQLDEAEKGLVRGIRLSKNFMPRIVVALGYIVLAYVFMSKEKWDDALNAMETSEQLFPIIAFPFTFVSQMLKGQVYLAANNLEAVAGLLDIKEFNEDFLLKIYEKMGVITYYQTLAQYLIAAGRADEVIPLLGRVEARSGHHEYKMLIIKTMQAMAHYATDDLAAVADAVMGALIAAAPEGYIRVFVDAGPLMADIFAQLQRDGHFEDPSVQTFAGEVMAHLRKKYPAKFKSDEFVISGDDAEVAAGKEKSGSVAVASGLVPWTYQLDPISEREIEVLELIAQGLNNKEIADQLYISVNTVKTHVSKILSKLDVKNRTAAVSTAREIGLIKIL